MFLLILWTQAILIYSSFIIAKAKLTETFEEIRSSNGGHPPNDEGGLKRRS